MTNPAEPIEITPLLVSAPPMASLEPPMFGIVSIAIAPVLVNSPATLTQAPSSRLKLPELVRSPVSALFSDVSELSAMKTL